MSHYFLTGSRGFIGSHLVIRLLQMGHEVETDLRYLHSRKYDAVIHLAARTNIGMDFDSEIFESNIVLTKEVFKSPCRIVAASSCSAAHLTNPYAYSKRYLEHLCGIHPNAVALRFFNVYGHGASRGIIWWLMQQPDGAKINVRGSDIIRDYVAVGCIIDEIIRSLDYTPGVYDAGTGIGTKTIDVCSLFMELTGKTFSINKQEAGSNEPIAMVSSRIIPHISLREGLIKTIKNGV